MNERSIMSNKRLLIVDDHQEIRELLQRFLTQYEFDTYAAQNGDEMLAHLNHHPIDLIILDLMLPGKDGLTLCQELRQHSNVPVIMLTAMGDEQDRIKGLNLGADDYLAKPFNPQELLARIHAIFRRTTSTIINPQTSTTYDVYHFDRWQLTRQTHQLVDEKQVLTSLTQAEFSMLTVFLNHPKQVLSREKLLTLINHHNTDVYDRAIDSIISRLRKKLELNPKQPTIIKTIWGGGYQLICSVTKQTITQ